MPAVEILSNSIDESKTQVYDYKRGWFTAHDPNLDTTARQDGTAKILSSACEDGIIKQAAKDAQLAVEGLLGVVGYDHVTLTVAESAPSACPILPTPTPSS